MKAPCFKTLEGFVPNKYIIYHGDGCARVNHIPGEPVDPNKNRFVLNLTSDPHARAAAIAYAKSVSVENPQLAWSLFDLVVEEMKKVLQGI